MGWLPELPTSGMDGMSAFDAYEREAAALEGARRERSQLPLLDEALEQLDVSLDALVAEALRAVVGGAPGTGMRAEVRSHAGGPAGLGPSPLTT